MRHIIRLLYREFILPIKEQWKIQSINRARKRAIRLADYRASMSNNKKHLVLADAYNNFHIVNREDFKFGKLPRRGRFDKRTTWQMLCDNAVYITSC